MRRPRRNSERKESVGETLTNNEEERGASDQLVGLTCMVGEQGGRRMTRRSFGLLQLLRVSAKETGSIQVNNLSL